MSSFSSNKNWKDSHFLRTSHFLTIFSLLSDCIIKLCFLLFFDTKLPWQFLQKMLKIHQKKCFQLHEIVKKFFFSWNITFSSQFSQLRQIALLNFRKRCKTLKKGLQSVARKSEKINIFFEYYIFFTIFSLLSDCITKLSFLLFFDTKLPWRLWKKMSKTSQRAFFQLQ